jgi:MYXO-CTERM domain-containing protein
MQRTISKLFAAALSTPLLFAASLASAAPTEAACGNIELAAASDCEFQFSGGCETRCEPINFVAACDGQCDVTVETTCTETCSSTCLQECKLNAGSFDCGASCELDCSGNCDARCAAETDKASCKAYCEGSCSNNCDAKCTAVAPNVTCETKCATSCQASCESQANVNCGYQCSTELTGGCKTDCQAPEGALFCDGQYVHVSNVDDCVAYLESEYQIDIQYDASATGQCDETGCYGEADASVSCAAAPVGSAPRDAGAIAAMALGLGFVVARRRRRA